MPGKSSKPQLQFIDEFEVWVTRKSIKNMHLRIKPPGGRIEVSAPNRISDREIRQFIRAKTDWIRKSQQRIIDSPASQYYEPTAQQKEEWKDLVSSFVPLLVARYEPILGVKAGKIAYRLMKSRWGSCQPATGRICINTRLALYPPQCLEYVVVHELCHLREGGHGPRFKSLMDSVMPDWRERRKILSDRV